MENKRKIFLTFGVTKSPECYAAEEAVKQKKQENTNQIRKEGIN